MCDILVNVHDFLNTPPCHSKSYAENKKEISALFTIIIISISCRVSIIISIIIIIIITDSGDGLPPSHALPASFLTHLTSSALSLPPALYRLTLPHLSQV